VTQDERYEELRKNRASSEHPAAASYRALRGRMVELWAAMPRMASVIDVNRMAAEAKEPNPKAERGR